MMLRDVVVGVAVGVSISVPTARIPETQEIQELVSSAPNFCRTISHANFAIRSIPVRRTRIELDDSKLGVASAPVGDAFTRPRRSDDAHRGIRARAAGTSGKCCWSRARAACAGA